MDSQAEIWREGEAYVSWMDDDVESGKLDIVLYKNGWLEAKETGEMYPPHTVYEVTF